MVLQQIVIHILLIISFFCISFCNDSFIQLKNTSPILIAYNSYQQTPLANQQFKNKRITPFQIAQELQQDFFHIINKGSYLSYHGKKITLSQKDKAKIEDLILLLENEFILLKENPNELIIKISTQQTQQKQFLPNSQVTRNLTFRSASIHLTNSKYSDQLNTELDFDYFHNSQLNANLKINSSSSRLQKYPFPKPRNKADLDIEEFFLTWKPKTNIKQIQAGKYKQHIGLGLAQSATVEGLELEKLYHDYNIKIGYHDGLFASLTTPHFLDIPFTFYSIQRNTKQNNLSNATHSGLYFNKSFKDLTLYSEVSEYQDHGQFNGYGSANKDSAFSVKVKYRANNKITFASSLSHLGQNYYARHKNTNLHHFSQENNQSLQKELYYSLSGYFGNSLNSVSGISDFKLNVDLNLNQRSRISLVYDQIYDHSNDRRNKNNQLGLTTLYLNHQMKHKYNIQVSIQHLDFYTSGVANTGFLQNKARVDGALFRSSIQYSF